MFKCQHSYWSPIWLKFGVLSKSLHSILIKWVFHPPSQASTVFIWKSTGRLDSWTRTYIYIYIYWNEDKALFESRPSGNVKIWKACQLFLGAFATPANMNKKRGKKKFLLLQKRFQVTMRKQGTGKELARFAAAFFKRFLVLATLHFCRKETSWEAKSWQWGRRIIGNKLGGQTLADTRCRNSTG